MDFVSFCVFDPEIGREKVSFVFVMIAAAFSDSDLLWLATVYLMTALNS